MTFAHFSLKTRITQVSFGLFSKHKEHCFLISIAPSCISLKKSIGEHFNGSKIFLLYFYDAYDVNLWKKNLGESTAYSCRANLFAEFQHSFSKVILNQLNLWLFINCYGKVGEKKKFTYRVNFFATKLCILPNRNPRNTRSELSTQLNRNHETHLQGKKKAQKGRLEEVCSCYSVFPWVSLGNIKGKKPALVGPCCRTEQWDYDYCLEWNSKFLRMFRLILERLLILLWQETQGFLYCSPFWSSFIWSYLSSKKASFW